jgi:hypothetical protein
MPAALPHPTRQARHLAPFILLALALHLALLFALRLPMRTTSAASPRPFIVSFATPPAAERPREESSLKQRAPVKLPTAIETTATEPIQPDATPLPEAPLNTLLESAHNIARDEAQSAEHDYAEQERKRLATPAASLERYLRQPHKEIRLANGMLKIITGAGTVCFQDVPYFARDSAGVFGIPSTCP